MTHKVAEFIRAWMVSDWEQEWDLFYVTLQAHQNLQDWVRDNVYEHPTLVMWMFQTCTPKSEIMHLRNSTLDFTRQVTALNGEFNTMKRSDMTQLWHKSIALKTIRVEEVVSVEEQKVVEESMGRIRKRLKWEPPQASVDDIEWVSGSGNGISRDSLTNVKQPISLTSSSNPNPMSPLHLLNSKSSDLFNSYFNLWTGIS